MNAYRLRPLNFHWAPMLYSLAVLSALILAHTPMMPLPHFDSNATWLFGAILTVASVFLAVWGVKTLIENETTVLPNKGATHLVTRGPYRYTRNPIYLGYTLVIVAMGLMTGNAWFFLTAMMAALSTTYVAIRCEEMHLAARFGIEYERYCRRTRRWL